MEKQALEVLTDVCAVGAYEALIDAAWIAGILMFLMMVIGFLIGRGFSWHSESQYLNNLIDMAWKDAIRGEKHNG